VSYDSIVIDVATGSTLVSDLTRSWSGSAISAATEWSTCSCRMPPQEWGSWRPVRAASPISNRPSSAPAREIPYRHHHGSPGHGGDHLLPVFVSPSVSIPVLAGRAALGTWQRLVLIDTNVDNRQRRVRFSFLEG